MSIQIFPHLTLAYDVIKYLHELYIKYNKIIHFVSFKSCGKGIDTIYDIIQSNTNGPILLSIKLVHIKKYNNEEIKSIIDIFNYVLLLPVAIITPIGKWTFIDTPKYMKNDPIFSLELIKTFNLRFIYPSYIDKFGVIKDALFIPTNIIEKKYLDNCDKFGKLDLRHLFKIYNNEDLIKFNTNINYYISDFIHGYEISLYIFDRFIKNIMIENKFNDIKKYLTEYNTFHDKNEYFYILKSYFHKQKLFGYNKNIYQSIFYYTYLNYFGIYDYNANIFYQKVLNLSLP